MTNTRTALLLGTLLAACASPRVAQAPPQPLPVQPVARTPISAERLWLSSDCSCGEPEYDAEHAKEALRGRGVQAEDLFLKTLRDGLDPGRREEIERRAKMSFERRRHGLAQRYAITCLTPALKAEADAVSLAEYIADALKCHDIVLRERAMFGLVAIQSRRAIPELQRIAGEDDNPLRESALRALRELG